jgi:hypothetical protein
VGTMNLSRTEVRALMAELAADFLGTPRPGRRLGLQTKPAVVLPSQICVLVVVTPRIFAVEFFLFFTRQNSGVTFSFSFSPR